jgi:ATP-dependent Clp protease ATP-binding subunit ClpB
LKAKADRAERNYDLATAADLRHYAIPDAMARLEKLEAQKRQDDQLKGDLTSSDNVTSEAIAEIVARWTGIPAQRLKSTEKDKLLQMEKVLSQEIVGQKEAVKAVSNAIRLSRSGLANQDKPLASFLFVGPSGTGKTQLCKALARFLFDSEDAMIRIDGSEYSEKHTISRLIGAPPGYLGHGEGGALTEFVRRKPYVGPSCYFLEVKADGNFQSVVLIDEIEKASREFTTIFLQVMDAGRLTDSQGRIVNFKNTVIIMTSNLGAQHLNASPDGPISKQTRALVDQSIRNHFLPEFIGRL